MSFARDKPGPVTTPGCWMPGVEPLFTEGTPTVRTKVRSVWVRRSLTCTAWNFDGILLEERRVKSP